MDGLEQVEIRKPPKHGGRPALLKNQVQLIAKPLARESPNQIAGGSHQIHRLQLEAEAKPLLVADGTIQARGIVDKDGTIALSNVMVVGNDGKPVRREKIARDLGAKEKARQEKRKAASR